MNESTFSPHRQLAASRRRNLQRLLAVAAGVAIGPGVLRAALAADSGAGVRTLEGDVLVGGRQAQPGQAVEAGQEIETGADGRVVFVLGQDAFLLRENTRFVIEDGPGVRVLRYISGKVLSVFGPGRKQLDTPTATIGIRGTGCYLEAELARTYFCLCYGRALLVPKGDPNRRKSLRTRRHEYPVYVDRSAGAAAVLPAHVVNHSDDELIMLEALLGRRPPFLDDPGSGSRY